MVTGKFHNEDLSIYFAVKNVLVTDTKTLGEVARIVDSYPYNEIESSTLVLPTVAVETAFTTEVGAGELGASWYKRSWEVTVFATSDVQRDDISEKIFDAFGVAIPIRDYSGGYRIDSGLSPAGTQLRIIEYMNADHRTIRPAYAFTAHSKIKYWRATVGFDTVSSQAR